MGRAPLGPFFFSVLMCSYVLGLLLFDLFVCICVCAFFGVFDSTSQGLLGAIVSMPYDGFSVQLSILHVGLHAHSNILEATRGLA